jgi:hypothetical protein
MLCLIWCSEVSTPLYYTEPLAALLWFRQRAGTGSEKMCTDAAATVPQ